MRICRLQLCLYGALHASIQLLTCSFLKAYIHRIKLSEQILSCTGESIDQWYWISIQSCQRVLTRGC